MPAFVEPISYAETFNMCFNQKETKHYVIPDEVWYSVLYCGTQLPQLVYTTINLFSSLANYFQLLYVTNYQPYHTDNKTNCLKNNTTINNFILCLVETWTPSFSGECEDLNFISRLTYFDLIFITVKVGRRYHEESNNIQLIAKMYHCNDIGFEKLLREMLIRMVERTEEAILQYLMDVTSTNVHLKQLPCYQNEDLHWVLCIESDHLKLKMSPRITLHALFYAVMDFIPLKVKIPRILNGVSQSDSLKSKLFR
ncbi:hypothetical protein EGR_02459 [Echinococcus granulosus]|uniref:Uncharacterized protein n=1 Tax=Echinococcus granulosus TaxID=6210 RepID=W6UNC3_ECHGR|nr:hypothetical protein EGR_02459 [Echinococcus granulosus]EUB62663.1 hypothetical protein EGR_02459 [Echinococcus granulosus]